jgi:serine phosphatase RsbU (regulator of sigma subunit)/putative methionine-R-sulfoxide reductase with GAF domain
MKTLPHDKLGPPSDPVDPELVDLAASVQVLQAELQQLKASARESARMFEHVRARVLELSALNTVSRAVISTLDLHELLCVALQQTVRVAAADTGSIMLLDPGAGVLRIVVAHGLSGGVVEETAVPVGEGIAGWVAEHRTPILIPNAAHDPRFHLSVPREDVRSAISVPLLTPNDMLGVVNVARTSGENPFTDQDLQLLGTLANQIAMAVGNARLFEDISRRNRELSLLTSVSSQLSQTMNIREVREIIVDQACAILDADAGALFLLDERNDVMRTRVTRFMSPDFHRRVRARLGIGVIGDVALTGVPVYIENIAAAPSLESLETHVAEGLESMLCVPLRAGGQSLGAVAIYTRDSHHWAEHDLSLFISIADQGAMALHNAQSYQYQRGIAELVQKNLMPHMDWDRENLEIGHRYLPAKTVGGDYYDIFHLQNGSLAILMADVAGKSVAAAVHTAKGKYFIRALGYDTPSPADVLRRANALIYADTAVETFISAFYAVLDADRRTLRYCNAGHPPPILMRGTGVMTELDQPDILLGVLPTPPFSEHAVTLEPGDTVILTTDGVTEARAASVLFGQEGLRRSVARHRCLPPQALANAVVDDVLHYADSNVRDDIAVLVIRIPAA